MNRTEMEDAIQNFDRRLISMEQILPTLATKADLLATTEDLRSDVRAEMRSVRSDLQAEIRATGNELREQIDEVKRHADVRIGDAREDIRRVAEGVAAVATSLQANTRVLEDVVRQLDRHETILETLARRGT